MEGKCGMFAKSRRKKDSTERSTATERTCDTIKHAIITLEVQPGQPLYEQEIARNLKVSRTPVREALRLLSREGLVRIIPGRGAFVTEIAVKDIVEVYQLRQSVEGLAAMLAASSSDRLDDLRELLKELDEAPQSIRDAVASESKSTSRDPMQRFSGYEGLIRRIDHAIVSHANNKYLARIVDDLWQHARRFRYLAYQRPERLLQSVDEHKNILEAILERDPEKANQAVRHHIQQHLTHALTQLGESMTNPALFNGSPSMRGYVERLKPSSIS